MRVYYLIFIIILFFSCEENGSNMNCSDDQKPLIVGNGEIITRTLDIEKIVGIRKSGLITVSIGYGEEQIIMATGDSNIIDFLDSTVEDELWNLRLVDDFCYENFEVSVNITVPSLEVMSVSGSGNIELREIVSNISRLEIRKSGNSNITVVKKSLLDNLIIDASGSGLFRGFNLEAKKASITKTGSGDIEITAKEELLISMSGSGNIYYRGQPEINSTQSGSGNIIDAN